jgi:molecular chaperone DnaK
VTIRVFQGEREMAADNKLLGQFDLVGIPPAPRGVPQIEVAFDIDANGIVSVTAKDLGTGKSQNMKISAQSGLTKDEVARIVAAADGARGDDEKRKRQVELVNNAEGLIYTTEHALQEYASSLEADDVELIKDDLAKLKNAVEKQDFAKLPELYTALETSAHRMAEALYAKA